jgi:hypothetical protein
MLAGVPASVSDRCYAWFVCVAVRRSLSLLALSWNVLFWEMASCCVLVCLNSFHPWLSLVGEGGQLGSHSRKFLPSCYVLDFATYVSVVVV